MLSTTTIEKQIIYSIGKYLMNNSNHFNTEEQGTVPTNLNLKQYCAIELLLTGKTDAEVAQIVGVDSETLWHWRTQEPEFVIAMNSLRAAVWEASLERLRNTISKALDVIEQAVARGDEMVAIALLQALVRQQDR